MLYKAIQEALPGLFGQTAEMGGLPNFVQAEFSGYLGCGDLRRGFVRLKCNDCKAEQLLPFSCKGRSICPSCTSKRAAHTGAHLIDNVLPKSAFRQWTLAFPRQLRLVLALDEKLLGQAVGILVKAIFSTQKKRAKGLGMAAKTEGGAVAFLQNFTGALLLYPHAHLLVAEGVFSSDDDGSHTYAALPPPTDEEVERVLERVIKRVTKLVADKYPDGLPYATDAKQALSLASVQTRLFLDEAPPHRNERRVAFSSGFSLHANTWVHENDRQGLERLIRYGARGPLVLERLAKRNDGKLSYRLKKPRADGGNTLVMTPLQLAQRLSALVWKPKIHLTRYYGVFSAHHAARRAVAPNKPAPVQDIPLPAAESNTAASNSFPELLTSIAAAVGAVAATAKPPRLDWQTLLRRTFGFEVLRCPCGGSRRVLALITNPTVIRKILGPTNHSNSKPSSQYKAQAPPQLNLEF